MMLQLDITTNTGIRITIISFLNGGEKLENNVFSFVLSWYIRVNSIRCLCIYYKPVFAFVFCSYNQILKKFSVFAATLSYFGRGKVYFAAKD